MIDLGSNMGTHGTVILSHSTFHTVGAWTMYYGPMKYYHCRMKQHFSTYEPLLQELKKKYEVSPVTSDPCPLNISSASGYDQGEDIGMFGAR